MTALKVHKTPGDVLRWYRARRVWWVEQPAKLAVRYMGLWYAVHEWHPGLGGYILLNSVRVLPPGSAEFKP